jgi:uncharacterized phage protein (TIGR02218 family)
MKAVSGVLITRLNGNTQFLMADLYTLTLWDSTVYRWTTADLDITFGGNKFLSMRDQDTGTPLIERGTTRCVVGLEVDTLDLTLRTGQTVLMAGIPMVKAACNGIFDGARLMLERAFLSYWDDPSVETVVLFEGNVAGCDPSSTSVHLTVKSELERMNVALPKYLYQPACGHTIYSAGCGLSRASFTQAFTVVGNSGSTVYLQSDSPEATGFFNLGVLAITSGLCAGSRRAVRSYDLVAGLGCFTLAMPLPQPVQDGDTFTVYPGCDRTRGAYGCARFNNLNRFRGFPFVPRPETAR